MPRFNANLSMMFCEHDFLDRFQHARAQKFQGVEFLFPYDFHVDEIGEAISKHNLELVLFNMPPGNFGEGERGLACLPDRINEFEDSVEAALEYAVPLGCSRLHCMAGIKPDNYSQKKIRDTYIKNIQYAADKCAPKNINIMIEAINTRDMPNFY